MVARGKEAIMQHMRTLKTPTLRSVTRLLTLFPQREQEEARDHSDSESDGAVSVSSCSTDDSIDRDGEDDPRLQRR